VKQRARHDLRRRLARLEWLPGTGEVLSLQVGADHLCDWLDDEEFEQLAELMTERGLPVEAEECQMLLLRAWGRRARKEPRARELWRVLFEEGRIQEAEEELKRCKAWGR
jgi:hypothetical protein